MSTNAIIMMMINMVVMWVGVVVSSLRLPTEHKGQEE